MHPSVPAGELFDFDAEVEPLLEVLVGKVLEQALMEVLEEEEIAALQQHQAHFEAIRWAACSASPASGCDVPAPLRISWHVTCG
jgi:hypothetical protein